MKMFVFAFILILAATGCAAGKEIPSGTLSAVILSGGRSWYLQSVFDGVYGVVSTEAGNAGNGPGQDGNEAVRVVFHTGRIAFEEILAVYFSHIDPADADGQFNDRGKRFRPVIYFDAPDQRESAAKALAALAGAGKSAKPVAVGLEKAGSFTPAGAADQHLSVFNPARFKDYLARSGRNKSQWPSDYAGPLVNPDGTYVKPAKEALRTRLTPIQYSVTQEDDTEPAFANEYWNNHGDGIYVDVVSGEPLFSSRDKFESGTGWPSFIIPLVPANVLVKPDDSFGMVRTEVRSRFADSHLGHVFDDGPPPTGLRYCMDSAALRFIPVQDMQKDGYGAFLPYLTGSKGE
jgi:peptide methionine sulfoxide reductase msrA/msrB